MSDRRDAPHLLYVAWGFPPSRGGGVYRALATANAFANAGWRVTVLTAEREAFERYTGLDATLEDHVDPSIRIERLPFSWPLLDTDIRRYSWLRAHSPARWRKRHVRKDTADFPEAGYGPWRKVLEQAALRIHQADPVDLVVATANPNVDFTAAWVLNRRHGVPFVMDYRDAWLLDVFEGGMLHEEGSRAAVWERDLIAAAHEVWFVNEPIRAWHQKRYPASASRMHVVSNGFDPELAPPARHHAADAGAGLTFGYLGTISPKVPLAELIEGWRSAREDDELVATGRLRLHGYLGYYAAPRADLANLVEDAADADVSYEGPVAKTEIAAVYESFDVLLLVIGAGRYVTSGKVFEYIATGMPIVSVHDPINAASDVLRGYPMWFPVRDLDPASVAEALTAAAHAAVNADDDLRDRCRAFAASYERDLQLLPRVQELSTSVGGLVVIPAPAPTGGAESSTTTGTTGTTGRVELAGVPQGEPR
ncbi:MAG: glycosyltransferase [Kineosporiaceae bacterium]|nr:glycosyltransferase [Kineosporiaceae bacterium]